MSIYVKYFKKTLKIISNCNNENGIIDTLELTLGLGSYKTLIYDS